MRRTSWRKRQILLMKWSQVKIIRLAVDNSESVCIMNVRNHGLLRVEKKRIWALNPKNEKIEITIIS